MLIDEVYARQKHPFMSPPATLQQDGRLYVVLHDTLRSAVLDGPGIYDRSKVTALLDRARPRRYALMWMTRICLLSDRMGV